MASKEELVADTVFTDYNFKSKEDQKSLHKT